MGRTDTLIADVARREIEKDKVTVALRHCGYPECALKEGKLLGKKQLRKEEEKSKHPEQEGEKSEPKARVVLPYAAHGETPSSLQETQCELVLESWIHSEECSHEP